MFNYEKRSESKVVCDKCSLRLPKYQLSKHKDSLACLRRFNAIGLDNIDKLSNGKLVCLVCGKEFKDIGPIKCHIKKVHSGKVYDYSYRKKIKKSSWNKGLTKDIDERVRKSAETTKERIRLGLIRISRKKIKHNEEFLKALSIKQSLRNSGGKCKWYEVGGQSVQGTWERNVANKFEELGVKWKKLSVNRDILTYVLDGKTKNYTPDFYLQDFSLYIELKGFWWGNDKRKMETVLSQHRDKNILIIEKEDYQRILRGEQVWLLPVTENHTK